MKSKLTLKNPVWDRETRRRRLSQLVHGSAAELEAEIKGTILNSRPAGRTYRRSAITAPFTKKKAALGLKVRKTAKGNKRLIVGSNFHRASAPGQAPAVDSSNLLNSIRARRIDDLKAKVSTSVKYAAALDNGATISGRNKRTKIVGPMRNRTIAKRPYFKVTVEKFKPRYKTKISEVFNGDE